MTHVSLPSDRRFNFAGQSSLNRFSRRASLLFLLLFSAAVGVAQSVIYTVAGGGSASGASASPGWVTGVAVDASGNLFLAISDASVVMRLDAVTGALTTVVGTGVAGYNGDSVAASSAQLNAPLGIALDSSGNLYIADSGNNRVRKVSGGTITTVAGNGTSGDSGDGGLATSASINNPVSVTLDLSSNLYIQEQNLTFSLTGGTVIRKVSNGIITTFASASITQAYGIAADASGDVFWVEITSAGFVHEIPASGGPDNIVAGCIQFPCSSSDGVPATSATLKEPLGIALDSSGNIYFADSDSNRIRKVSNGIVTTIAGNGTAGFTGDGGLATSAEMALPSNLAFDSSGNVYIIDSGNQRVRKVSASSGVITTVIGNGAMGSSGDGGPATAAELSLAPSVAVDSSGNVYIAEVGNQRVRKVSNGTITTVAGDGTQGFSGDGGAATSAELNTPMGMAHDSAGDLYIADTGNERIRKVSNGTITTVAGNGTEGYSGDGGSATGAQLKHPIAVAVDASGNLYIADIGNQAIRKVSGGIISTITRSESGSCGDGGPALRAFLNGPSGLALDGAGNLYVADSANQSIRKISNGVITTVAGDGAPTACAGGGAQTTRGYSGDGGPATSAQMNYPVSIAVDASGNLYIADSLNQRIRKVSNGVITTVAGNGTAGFSGDGGSIANAELAYPTGVAVDTTGNLYIADLGNKRIRAVGLPPFSISSNPTSMTIASPGASNSATITATPTAGFSGIVMLSCAVAYNGPGTATDPPTCRLGASQLSFPTNGSTTLTASTTPAHQAGVPFGPRDGWKWSTGSFAILFAILFVPALRREKRGSRFLIAVAVLGGLALFPGCGGGGSSGGGGGGLVGGTTAGNYTVTITATSGGYSTSTGVPLVVQ